ncbi:Carboxylesterase type B [Beutenbergia cavernae DSM 12333]|uniref:Carboxylic ester hydrolase n=1 Tax=Beutenbergia cavernae (strain ATCC BAA-8 / DSM 12333 / CCUG 43141 / JCM 11478 / NBRC 16432 / NCIMB 13614 / HKI 0122) TaxID=471853 RepID=C5BY90_BEUC1|nr:carboxylesterase family protein [Beutenbergia cavernae]ACQ80990.1 Carboxylesterase type B [Beutenbergia cavernae DSM 12333]
MTTDDLVVTTAAGDVAGVRRAPSHAAFLGIPFAEPPVGERRLAAPVPRGAWDGVRPCREYGPTPQRRRTGGGVTSIPEPSIPGEDTLAVNVFTPAPGDRQARLPVLVWIHGGGYTSGSPASPWYDGRTFAARGIVTVTISYRLGFDGFGLLPDAPPNRAVLDWLLALAWVQENIAAFGGDPDAVTIAGQSAGGGAVLTLLAMPRAQGLFRRAIAQSGALADLPSDAAEATTAQLATELGVTATRDGFRSVPEATVLEAQHALTANDLADPAAVFGGLVNRTASPLTFGPVIDGDLVTAPASASMARGTGTDVPLLAGTTAHEFNGVVTSHAPAALRFVPATLVLRRAGMPHDVTRDYLRARNGTDTPGVVGQLLTDLLFRAPLAEVLMARQAAGATSWAYDFRWPSPLAHGTSPHCLDAPFVWNCLDAERVTEVNTGPHPPQELADAMHGTWAAFVAGDDPDWPAFAAPDHAARVFTVPPVTARNAYAIERRLAGR